MIISAKILLIVAYRWKIIWTMKNLLVTIEFQTTRIKHSTVFLREDEINVNVKFSEANQPLTH